MLFQQRANGLFTFSDNSVEGFFIISIGGKDFVDDVSNDDHVFFLHAAGGDSGGSQADAAGDGGFFGIKGDGILVAGDIDSFQSLLCSLAGDSLGS